MQQGVERAEIRVLPRQIKRQSWKRFVEGQIAKGITLERERQRPIGILLPEVPNYGILSYVAALAKLRDWGRGSVERLAMLDREEVEEMFFVGTGRGSPNTANIALELWEEARRATDFS